MRYISIICCLATLFLHNLAFAEIAVVVHPSNPINDISKSDLSRIYLAKSKAFSHGPEIQAFDLEKGQDLRDEFYKIVSKKTPYQMEAYWTKLIFTGKAAPPIVLTNSAEVVLAVSEDTDSIGYVDLESVDGSVKVILTLN